MIVLMTGTTVGPWKFTEGTSVLMEARAVLLSGGVTSGLTFNKHISYSFLSLNDREERTTGLDMKSRADPRKEAE